MQEYFFRLKVRDDGSGVSLEAFSKQDAIRLLMRPNRLGKGIFSIDGSEEGDVLLLKQAVHAVGGVRQLAFALGVNREVFYNWLHRGVIPEAQRAKIEQHIGLEIPQEEDEECAD